MHFQIKHNKIIFNTHTSARRILDPKRKFGLLETVIGEQLGNYAHESG